MQENRRLLIERGEKLDEMEIKSGQLEADGEEFHAMATKLAKQEKGRWF